MTDSDPTVAGTGSDGVSSNLRTPDKSGRVSGQEGPVQPAGPSTSLPYDREVLVNTLIYHWRSDIKGCGCGWAVLGASHPEHVADIYEESVAERGRQA